jgi:elongation factor G
MGAKVFSPTDIRNVAIVGHGFCGKTALAEAMLLNAGATTRLGRTDQGTSTFDFEPEEQKRGGSVASAFAWIEVDGKKINVIDTPGDQNFMYDSFAAMQGADSVVVVVSAPDGVEVQTERVWHRAEEHKQPRLVFINKMDRERANWKAALKDIEETFGVKPIPMQIPIGLEASFVGVVDLHSRKALTWARDASGRVTEGEIPAELRKEVEDAEANLVESIASTDDALIEKYLEEGELSPEEVAGAFRSAFLRGEIVPVLFGSASNNIGVQPLMKLLAEIAPSPVDLPEMPAEDADGNTVMIQRSPDAPFLAHVIRTFIDEFSGKVTVMRIFSGSAPADGQVQNLHQGQGERLGSLHVQRGKEREAIEQGVCGDIVSVAKLKVTHTNESLVDTKLTLRLKAMTYPQPMMSFVIQPLTKGDEDRLKVVVDRLIEEDPTLSIAYDELSHAMVLNGMGQAHLDISIEKMKRKFKVAVKTDLPAVPYRETISRQVTGIEGKHKKQTGGAGQFGVAFIDVYPTERGVGFEFVDRIFGGAIPRQFIPSVEKGLRERMKHGALAGYPVVDVRVELMDGKYHPVDSKDIAFQLAGAKGLKAAFEKVGMKLLEPYYKMEIVAPTDNMGDIMGDITARRGRVMGMDARGKNTVVHAICPLAEILRYAPDLHSMTGGKGSFVMEFSSYEDVPSHLVEKIRAASPFKIKEEDDD